VTGMLRVCAAVLAVGVVLAGPSGSSASASIAAAPASGKVKIKVGDNFFKPDEVEIVAGTKVVWANKGKILHNVQPAKKAKWGTKSLVKGKTYSYKFKDPGTYAYYCSFHGSPTSGQRGVITVVAAPPPTTTTSVPAG
jgi:plastocyanin